MKLKQGTWIYQNADFPHRQKYDWTAPLWTVEADDGAEVMCKHLNSSGIAIRGIFPAASVHVFPSNAVREPKDHGSARCSWTDDDGQRHAIVVVKDDLDRFDSDLSSAAK